MANSVLLLVCLALTMVGIAFGASYGNRGSGFVGASVGAGYTGANFARGYAMPAAAAYSIQQPTAAYAANYYASSPITYPTQSWNVQQQQYSVPSYSYSGNTNYQTAVPYSGVASYQSTAVPSYYSGASYQTAVPSFNAASYQAAVPAYYGAQSYQSTVPSYNAASNYYTNTYPSVSYQAAVTPQSYYQPSQSWNLQQQQYTLPSFTNANYYQSAIPYTNTQYATPYTGSYQYGATSPSYSNYYQSSSLPAPYYAGATTGYNYMPAAMQSRQQLLGYVTGNPGGYQPFNYGGSLQSGAYMYPTGGQQNYYAGQQAGGFTGVGGSLQRMLNSARSLSSPLTTGSGSLFGNTAGSLGNLGNLANVAGIGNTGSSPLSLLANSGGSGGTLGNLANFANLAGGASNSPISSALGFNSGTTGTSALGNIIGNAVGTGSSGALQNAIGKY